MLAQIATRIAAIGGRGIESVRTRFGSLATLVLLALVGHGCSAPPAPVAGPDPADPHARVPPSAYRSTIGPYTSQRPVEPAPWSEQNQRIAPQPKSGQ
jgi:hypothetical protein